jgi:hypothetical protein
MERLNERESIITITLEDEKTVEAMIRAFLDKQIPLLEEKYPLSRAKEFRKDQRYQDMKRWAMLLLQSLYVLNGLLKNADRKQSFFSYTTQGGEVIGFSLVGVRHNEVLDTFLGVGWENLRQGVATRLLEERHAILRQRGILSYTTGLADASLGVHTKMVGTSVTKLQPDHPDDSLYRIELE